MNRRTFLASSAAVVAGAGLPAVGAEPSPILEFRLAERLVSGGCALAVTPIGVIDVADPYKLIGPGVRHGLAIRSADGWDAIHVELPANP